VTLPTAGVIVALDTAVSRPFASYVMIGATVAEPVGPPPAMIGARVGFGYEPARSPPADPLGVPPPLCDVLS
jgi:hypothetical protein